MAKRKKTKATGGKKKFHGPSKPPKGQKGLLPIRPPLKRKVGWTHFHWTAWNYFWVIFCGFASVLGVLSALCEFFPFLSIDPNASTSTSNFLDTKFVITNDSPLPIYHVTYKIFCWDGDYSLGGPRFVNVDNDIDDVERLDPHTPLSVRIQFKQLDQLFVKDSTNFVPAYARPFYEFDVNFTCCGIPMRRGMLFWAYKDKNGVYQWNHAGNGISFYGKDGTSRAVPDPLPHLAPPN